MIQFRYLYSLTFEKLPIEDAAVFFKLGAIEYERIFDSCAIFDNHVSADSDVRSDFRRWTDFCGGMNINIPIYVVRVVCQTVWMILKIIS